MSRIIASWGVALAVLLATGLSFGQDKGAGDPAKTAEELLASKDLRASAAVYILRGEDEVKKLAEAAEARLKEYRLAHAREKAAVKDMYDKKAYATELTKQRDEWKQQMDQRLPEIQASIQLLNQQKSLLQMQANSMRGARTSRYANMGTNTQLNQISLQVNALQTESNQIRATYNELNNQIKLLEAKPDNKADSKADDASKKAAAPAVPSSLDRRESYVQALGELRKHVDATKQKYTEVEQDQEVKSALETLSQRSAKIKYVLGPSKKFQDTVKALEQSEARVASETIIEEPKTASTAKKKSKTAKKK